MTFALLSLDEIEKLLGAPLYSSADFLLSKYQGGFYNTAEKQLACKIALDPFYRDALHYFGNIQSIYEAGYFDDGLEPGAIEKYIDTDWLTTPLYHIRKHLRSARFKSEDASKAFVVLLCTGGFAPVHEGHFRMMNIAKEKLESGGYNVLGGFLSPSHDGYVLNKCNTISGLTSLRRMHILNTALMESD